MSWDKWSSVFLYTIDNLSTRLPSPLMWQKFLQSFSARSHLPVCPALQWMRRWVCDWSSSPAGPVLWHLMNNTAGLVSQKVQYGGSQTKENDRMSLPTVLSILMTPDLSALSFGFLSSCSLLAFLMSFPNPTDLRLTSFLLFLFKWCLSMEVNVVLCGGQMWIKNMLWEILQREGGSYLVTFQCARPWTTSSTLALSRTHCHFPVGYIFWESHFSRHDTVSPVLKW